MPTHKQIMMDPPITSKGKGKSDTTSIKAMFPQTPYYNGDYDDEKALALGNETLLGASVNDGGHTFSTVSLQYTDAPDMASVDIGAHKLPNAYQPNPGSPGDGSMLATDQPDPPEGYNTQTEQFGSGVGTVAATSPDKTSATHASHTIGQYIQGKSAGTTG